MVYGVVPTDDSFFVRIAVGEVGYRPLGAMMWGAAAVAMAVRGVPTVMARVPKRFNERTASTVNGRQ